MLAVGLTGGIGSGKSRVTGLLQRLIRMECIDADQLCRELLLPGAAAWQGLRQELDRSSLYFTPSGELDRRRLRGAIFADGALRGRVEAVIHPLVQAATRRRLALCTEPLALVEVPLLFEAGWQGLFDRVVLVYAEPHVRRRRIALRDRLTDDEAMQALAAQSPLEEKIALADHVVDNGGCWAWTSVQVLHLGRLLERKMKRAEGRERETAYVK